MGGELRKGNERGDDRQYGFKANRVLGIDLGLEQTCDERMISG
jgi:hypothetical protein